MKWHLESWRKLYRTCPPSWLRLSVSARGLGSELLKYAEDDGSIDIGDDAPGVAVAYMLGARPREHKRIAEDVAELLRDGYLVVHGQKLQIRNFVEAQDRTPGAKRTAAWRAQKSADGTSHAELQSALHEMSQSAAHVASPEASPEASHVTSHVQGAVTTIRSDTIRSDPTRFREGALALAGNLQGAEHAPASPSPPKAEALLEPSGPPDEAELATEVKDAGKAPKRASNRGSRCPSSVSPEASLWCSGHGLPDPEQTPELRRMLDHFAAAPGAKGVKTDWAATWRNWSSRAAEFSRTPSRGPVRSIQPATPRTTMTLDEYVNSPANHQGDF